MSPLFAGFAHAAAGDATWIGTTANFNDAANWSSGSVPTATAFFGASANTNVNLASNVVLGGWTFNAGAIAYTFGPQQTAFTDAGIVAAGGAISITAANLQFRNTSSAGDANVTIVSSGTVSFLNASSAGAANLTVSSPFTAFSGTATAGSATITNNSPGTISFAASSTAGNAALFNAGTIRFIATSTAGNAVITNRAGGATTFAISSNAGNAALVNVNTASFDFSQSTFNTRQLTAGSLDGGGTFSLGQNKLTVGGNNRSTNVTGVITDGGLGGGVGGSLVKTGIGTMILSGANTYTGGTTIDVGVLQIGNGGTTGSIVGNVTNNGGLSFNRSDNIAFSGNISGSGGLDNNGAGNTVLTAINSYTGNTTVHAGTLSVNGSIASSAMTTVNAGGTLGGRGTVGNTTINGGALAPGNSIDTLTIAGNLVFTSASRYMVEVSTAAADRVNVSGTATLGGAAVNASFAAGSYVSTQYTIVNATGGVIGTFGSQVNANLPANFTSSLVYDANNVYLKLTLNYVPPTPPSPTPTPTPTPGPAFNALSVNQQRVADTLVNSFNRTGGIPMAFGALSSAGLTQVSGELATGSQQTTFDAMSLFLGLLTDPSASRGDGFTASGPSAFAEDGALSSLHRQHPNDAYAAIARKAPPRALPFETRWSVWGAGFGGSQTTDGNGRLGSNTMTSRIGGGVAGADVLLAPNTVAGFALAGGGTSFAVANGGSGRSDLFQAGAHLRHVAGSAYIAAALAYGWQDITTERSVGAGVLRANFNANAYSGRIEIGTRAVLPWLNGIGVTPYAAAEVTAFDLPAASETAVGGVNTFALTTMSKTATATRSEIGLRGDKAVVINDAILTLRGRAAWAHDFNTDRSIAASFQTLSDTSFVVSGAAPAGNAALAAATAEIRFSNGISLAATVEGALSDATRSYAGKGVARYSW